jgi:CRISPR-associated endonuclease/helicase Cas3
MNRLLAKSYDRKKYKYPPDYALLVQHSRDVASACKALAKMAGAIAISNAGLNRSLLADFSKTLLADGWMQDVGKANSHFQPMVSNSPEISQLLRHEVISGLLFWLDPKLSEWIAPLGKAKLMAIWGAMGHHRKFHAGTKPRDALELLVYTDHEDFRSILKEMAQDLGLDEPPIFELPLTIEQDEEEECNFSAQAALKQLIQQFTRNETEFTDEKSRRYLALIKAFGIAADVAASAVAKKHKSADKYSLAQFVTDDLSKGLQLSDLTKLIHGWAWSQLEPKNTKPDLTQLPPGFEVRGFQKEVAKSKSPLTLAIAGCGSGKSLAAYLWAYQWCEQLQKQEERTNFRLFFCLPTTGTTTEHFKDYALESGIPAEQISLTHSRSSVDLETMSETSIQEEAISDDDAISDTAKAACAVLEAERDKIESLALWSTPLVVTTADTILGLMVNARRSVYSLPTIMQSAIVFDEVHAFDDQLFGHLLVFLKNFPKLPVLLMTASLPEQRLQAILKVRSDLEIVPGPQELETLERYRIQYPTTDEEIWTAVKQCIADKGKVLWVCNRVEWANNTYKKAKNHFPNISANVYHSRLRYKDRSHRHRQVIDDFKHKEQASILVATQVAEMSLNLSADLLITDIASVPALIQRMGRLNRHACPEKPGQPKQALICQISSEKDFRPYEKEDLATAKTWINKLIALNRPLHQKDLADKFAAVSEVSEYDYAKAAERACFFGIPKKSGLWRTQPGMTRGEGYTISVILKQDYDKCNDFEYGQPSRDWLRKHEVSIPIKAEALKWECVAGIRIAPEEFIEYDYNEENHEGTGAKWR